MMKLRDKSILYSAIGCLGIFGVGLAARPAKAGPARGTVVGNSQFKLWNGLKGTVSTVSVSGERVTVSSPQPLVPSGAKLAQVTDILSRHGYLVRYRASGSQHLGFVPYGKPLAWSVPIRGDVQKACADAAGREIFLINPTTVEKLTWGTAAPGKPGVMADLRLLGRCQVDGAVAANGTLVVSFLQTGGEDTSGGLYFFPEGGGRRKHSSTVLDGDIAVVADTSHRLLAGLGYGSDLAVIFPSAQGDAEGHITLGDRWQSKTASVKPSGGKILVGNADGQFVLVTISPNMVFMPVHLGIDAKIGIFPEIAVDWKMNTVLQIDTQETSHLRIFQLGERKLTQVGRTLDLPNPGYAIVPQS